MKPKKKLNPISLIKLSKKAEKELSSQNKGANLDKWLSRVSQLSIAKKEDIDKSNVTEESATSSRGLDKVLFVQLERQELVEQKVCLKKERKQKPRQKKNRQCEYLKLSNKQYQCIRCDFIHNTLISVRSHYDKQHNNEIYKCKMCPFQTTQQYYFNSHVKSHSKPDKECPHCKKMIKWFSYKMHIKTHVRSNNTEIQCKFCDYRSYNGANVKRHTLTVHNNPHELNTFSCDSCDYVTILSERLKQHKKTVHSKEGVWITCQQCDYTTRNKFHMNRHVNDLHSEKKEQCPECLQLFSSKQNLKYHKLRKHNKDKNRVFYYCEMCPKEQRYKTTEKGNLARHILAHRTLDEIEVFACHKCPYLGKSKNALKTHLINAHLPEIHNYKCKICGYSTSTKSRYKCHIKDVHGKPKEKKHSLNKQRNDSNANCMENDIELHPLTDVDIKEESEDELDSPEYLGADTNLIKQQIPSLPPDCELTNKQDNCGG